MVIIGELKSYDKKKQSRELTNKKARRIKFRLLRLLSQRHNIVVYIRGSSGRTAEFRKLTEKIILINNRTR